MTTQTFTVTGMTCGHCVGAVHDEVARLADVEQVDVDLASGMVTVTAARTLGTDEVAGAVEEAGFELVR